MWSNILFEWGFQFCLLLNLWVINVFFRTGRVLKISMRNFDCSLKADHLLYLVNDLIYAAFLKTVIIQKALGYTIVSSQQSAAIHVMYVSVTAYCDKACSLYSDIVSYILLSFGCWFYFTQTQRIFINVSSIGLQMVAFSNYYHLVLFWKFERFFPWKHWRLSTFFLFFYFADQYILQIKFCCYWSRNFASCVFILMCFTAYIV